MQGFLQPYCQYQDLISAFLEPSLHSSPRSLREQNKLLYLTMAYYQAWLIPIKKTSQVCRLAFVCSPSSSFIYFWQQYFGFKWLADECVDYNNQSVGCPQVLLGFGNEGCKTRRQCLVGRYDKWCMTLWIQKAKNSKTTLLQSGRDTCARDKLGS